MAVAAFLALAAAASAEPPLGQISTIASASGPTGAAVLPDGSILVVEQTGNRVLKVSTAGVVTAVAGTGTSGFAGDGGPATAAQLAGPSGVASTGDGGFLIADSNNFRVRRVSPAGTISTVAGNGTACDLFTPCGDGASATSAKLALPQDVAPTADGGYLISDLGVNVIRKVAPDGTISKVAGTYETAGSFGGDGGPAVAAHLNNPYGISTTPDGGFLIADSANNRIRKVLVNGTITTVAGITTPCDVATNPCGDGGPATAAQLSSPHGVVSRPDGSLLIGDTQDNRVRAVSGGTISTIAGTGTASFSGDNGPATSATLNMPWGVATCGNTAIVADFGNNRARWFGIPPVTGTTPCVPVPAPPASGGGGGSSSTATTTTTTPTVPLLPAGVAPPVFGSSIVATPIKGTVRVRLPGTKTFIPLSQATNIPIGSEFDTTKGTVEIEFVAADGQIHTADFSKGLFKTKQTSADQGALEGDLSAKLTCARSHRASAARKKKGKGSRQVRVQAKGPVKTKGRYGSATVRGTAWTMKDTCTTTTTVVAQGTVAVRDDVEHKTVLVKAHKRYVIRAKR